MVKVDFCRYKDIPNSLGINPRLKYVAKMEMYANEHQFHKTKYNLHVYGKSLARSLIHWVRTNSCSVAKC